MSARTHRRASSRFLLWQQHAIIILLSQPPARPLCPRDLAASGEKAANGMSCSPACIWA